MGRETQNVLLVLVGGALIKIVVDGTYLRYVAPWSGPIVLAGGIAVVALAAVAIVRDVRGAEPADDHGSRAAWLMMLPVLAILMVAPPALGSGALTDAVARPVADGTAVAEEPLPPGDAPTLALVDVVSRAAADPHGPLTGRDVTVMGFVAPGPGSGRVDLVRWVIACCAADASPVRVHLAAAPGVLPVPRADGPDQWITVRARLVAGTGTAADGHVPTLTVTESLLVASPDSVYEY